MPPVDIQACGPGGADGVDRVAGIAARVINTPTAFIEDADGKVPADVFPRINDHLAELVAAWPPLHGLATAPDAY